MSVCRVCLAAGNTRLHSLINNQLIDVYDKLSSIKFNSEDARPKALCSFCYRKLLEFHTFSQMVHRSEKILSHLIHQGLETTQEYISELTQGIKQQFSVATIQYNPIDDNTTNADTQEAIEDESITNIVIKEEVITEQDIPVEKEPVPESFTKSESLVEDNSDQENELPPTTYADSQVAIKDEPMSCIDIKEEVITEHEKLVDVDPVPESITKSQILVEDNIDQENYLDEFPPTTNADTQVAIKDEPIIHIDIKEEVISEHEGSLVDVVSVPESFTKSKILVEDKNDRENHVKELPGNSHVEQTKPDNSKMLLKGPFACNLCDKRFTMKSYCVRHKRIHTGERPFACDVCDKTFKRNYKLVEHKRTHTGEKPFVCDVCDKLFNRKDKLVEHKRTHTGVKHFACNLCDKKYYRKDRLSEHKKTKHFACNLCDKKYYRKDKLVEHKRTHTGEKSFVCDVCNKIFGQNHDLVRHKRIHTGEKPFVCDVCYKGFNQNPNLVRHMRTHTGG